VLYAHEEEEYDESIDDEDDVDNDAPNNINRRPRAKSSEEIQCIKQGNDSSHETNDTSKEMIMINHMKQMILLRMVMRGGMTL
jgi:hypothetical protein